MRLFDLIHKRGIASEFLAISSTFSESEVAASLRLASWTRKSEFAAGRLAAKKALASFGIAAETIPQCHTGLPVWPGGSVGSISHSSTHACAVAAHASSYRSLGIDIEPESSVSRLNGLRTLFLTEAESSLTTLEAFIAFSAKESLFKMIFPLARQFFGFEAAVVKGFDDQTVTLTLNESIGSFSKGSRFQAFFEFYRGHVVTMCMLA